MRLLRTLGIETSCDETAVAVLDADGRIESEAIASQASSHARYGGVVPELASREHLQALPWLMDRALAAAARPPELVAVTAGPGLVGALLVLLGMVMLVTPGQGLLTLLVGLLLMNFPGKYRLERWLVGRRGVLTALNWLRRRGGHAPFEPPTY